MLRFFPPLLGVLAMVLQPRRRRSIARALEVTLGSSSWGRRSRALVQTFVAYARSLAEAMALGSPNEGTLQFAVEGGEALKTVLASGRGVVLVTAHTGGWDVSGSVLARDFAIPVTLVMAPEPDGEARRLQDAVRVENGVRIFHTEGEPTSALALLKVLREGGILCLQVDRMPEGSRGRSVRLLGHEARLPEGPLRLAQLSGAPVVPVFSARRGFRDYVLTVGCPQWLARRASEGELDAVAQAVADELGSFLRRFPTQWFAFDGLPLVEHRNS